MCVCGAASIPSKVGTALPSRSNFFINYVITQGIAMIPFRMMFPHIGVLVGLLRILRICGENPPAPAPPPAPSSCLSSPFVLFLLHVPPCPPPSPLPLPAPTFHFSLCNLHAWCVLTCCWSTSKGLKQVQRKVLVLSGLLTTAFVLNFDPSTRQIVRSGLLDLLLQFMLSAHSSPGCCAATCVVCTRDELTSVVCT